jgi:hypothetical protein
VICEEEMLIEYFSLLSLLDYQLSWERMERGYIWMVIGSGVSLRTRLETEGSEGVCINLVKLLHVFVFSKEREEVLMSSKFSFLIWSSLVSFAQETVLFSPPLPQLYFSLGLDSS